MQASYLRNPFKAASHSISSESRYSSLDILSVITMEASRLCIACIPKRDLRRGIHHHDCHQLKRIHRLAHTDEMLKQKVIPGVYIYGHFTKFSLQLSVSEIEPPRATKCWKVNIRVTYLVM